MKNQRKHTKRRRRSSPSSSSSRGGAHVQPSNSPADVDPSGYSCHRAPLRLRLFLLLHTDQWIRRRREFSRFIGTRLLSRLRRNTPPDQDHHLKSNNCNRNQPKTNLQTHIHPTSLILQHERLRQRLQVLAPLVGFEWGC